MTGIALLANTTQFLIAGQIPLFSADPDHARMAAGKNGYLHIFSVLPGHIIPIAALILFTGEDLRGMTRKILAGVIAVNSALLLLWVARGMLIYPVVTVVAMNFILNQKSYRLKKVLAVIVICLVIVSGVKYLRDVVRFGAGYNPSEQRIVVTGFQQGLLANAAVLYLTVALNYEILNRYTAVVPLLTPHSSGRIMAGNVTAYLPGSGAPYTELNFQNAIIKKNEKDLTLTSTLFGIPYLDFGVPGVLFISFLVGALYRAVWLRMISYGSPWSIFLYAYLISMAFFIPYAFMYTQVSFTWFLLSSFPVIFLCSCRVKGASLFHQKSRIAF
jgi:oligosaccharide repeat unit polymerase